MFTILTQAGCAAEAEARRLTLPHAPQSGEVTWLEVKVGAIARDEKIEITTPDGKMLGVISPFGVRSGEDAGQFTIPIPAEAIAGDHVELRLVLKQPGHANRAPDSSEVKSIDAKISNPKR